MHRNMRKEKSTERKGTGGGEGGRIAGGGWHGARDGSGGRGVFIPGDGLVENQKAQPGRGSLEGMQSAVPAQQAAQCDASHRMISPCAQ